VARWLQVLERDTLDVMARQGVGGALALAAVPTFATRWLIPRLPLLAQQHPDIVVHMDTQTRPFLFADTAYDAALYAGTPEQVAQWPGTQAQLLMHEEVLPVCSPQLLESAPPGAGARAPAGGACGPGRTAAAAAKHAPLAWRQWFDAMGVDAPRALDGPRYELFSMLAQAATLGMGVALIPPHAHRGRAGSGATTWWRSIGPRFRRSGPGWSIRRPRRPRPPSEAAAANSSRLRRCAARAQCGYRSRGASEARAAAARRTRSFRCLSATRSAAAGPDGAC
jgi:DNA-binding transcriptional LysR family regulator